MRTNLLTGSSLEREGRQETRRGGAGSTGGSGRFSVGRRLLLVLLLVLMLPAAVFLVSRAKLCPVVDLSAYPWLYLRDDEPLTSSEDVVEVVAVGDVMLGRELLDEPRPFGASASFLREADLTLGNLECVIASRCSTQTEKEPGQPSPLRADPSAVAHLEQAGFDVLGLANNHAFDLGRSGLAETATRLRVGGIAAAGVDHPGGAALEPVVREVRGVRVALLAFSAVPGGRDDEDWVRVRWDPERAAAAVNAARRRADGVIVSIHWGYEYQTEVDPAQREAAQTLLRAGADLVLGHHPHVVQSFEVADGDCVAYSLGNLVFDQGQGETDEGLALRAFFDEAGLRAVQALPIHAGPQPRLMTVDEARRLLARVEGDPKRLTFVCDEGSCRTRQVPSDEGRGGGSGVFWGGRVDLTGDGVSEHVRRIGERVIIYQGAKEVWQSPDPWRVVDLAMGDPNDDGRSELLLALWKPGLDGLEPPSAWKEQMPRSRPFIVGYRGGIYRTLWGGSAVSHPIEEVELGDVHGDLAEELVVLEAREDGSGKRSISVWAWHGWGFSLLWRSQPGRYRDLVVRDDGAIDVAVE